MARIPADGIAIAKEAFRLVEQLQAYQGEEVTSYLVHAFGTNLRFEDGEFNFVKARAEHGDQDLEIVGVDHDDIASDARQFAQEQGAEWPLVFDGDDAIAELFGVRPIPQTFFIRSDGTIVSRIFGFTTKRELNAELDKILP